MGLLKIRTEQMAGLKMALGGDFEQRMYQWIERQLPRKIAKMGPIKTKALIGQAVPRARAYGMVSEKEIIGFVHLAFLWNDGSGAFQEYADARPILQSPHYSAEEKIIQARIQFKKVLVEKVKVLTAKT